MPRFIDLTGQKFGRLLVIAQASRGACGQIRWVCLCDCGTETIVLGGSLRWGDTKSCGCWHREAMATKATKHGRSGSPEYRSWSMMLNRCRNPKNKDFARYGGRGIAVCERWQDFELFLADMGPRPSKGHSIERVDGDEGYGPDNWQFGLVGGNIVTFSANHETVSVGLTRGNDASGSRSL